jgi:eukaryotic-like serine/threonine-protein kinase
MKRCPECRRDYYDDTLAFCLEDGTALLQGSVPSPDEPQTAILSEPGAIATGFGPGETQTKPQILTTDETTILRRGAGAEPHESLGGLPERQRHSATRAAKPLIAAAVAVVVLVGGFFAYRYYGGSSGQINSIAVLPFANASGDRETEFLADGIAETLINNFTKIPELKVTARSTAFSFRGRESEIKAIGAELGVGSILTGRLMQRGDQLGIQVDLINTSDGSQIWGNRYEGRSSDIVSIQQRIATDVSSQLKLKLSGAQQQQIAKTYTQNPEAYQHYLRGRFHWNKRTADDLRKGLQEFQQAADIDPGYALAYVGLADSYALMDEYAGVSTIDTLPKAQAFAERALKLDDTLGEAHATLALVNRYLWRWDEADKEFRRAIELNPNYPTTRHWYSVTLRDSGRLDEALQQIKRAHELDPLSGIIGSNMAIIYLVRGDEDATYTTLNKMIEINPGWWGGHNWLGLAYLEFGRKDEASKSLEKAVELNRSHTTLGNLGFAYALNGKHAEAKSILAELEGRYSNGQKISFNIAGIHAGLGDRDRALEWLEKAHEEKSSILPIIGWYPHFKSIRGEPRFKDLLKRMNLPE